MWTGTRLKKFVQADGDFDVLTEESVLPDEATHGVSSTELLFVMKRVEVRQVAERLLTEARVASVSGSAFADRERRPGCSASSTDGQTLAGDGCGLRLDHR
nr:phage tail protein [uncultured Shimia sp.]